jgi:hypothetical protein
MSYILNLKKIEDLDIKYLCDRLLESHSKLVDLNYEKKYLKIEQGKNILNSLLNNTSLVTLNMKNNMFGEGKEILK